MRECGSHSSSAPGVIVTMKTSHGEVVMTVSALQHSSRHGSEDDVLHVSAVMVHDMHGNLL